MKFRGFQAVYGTDFQGQCLAGSTVTVVYEYKHRAKISMQTKERLALAKLGSEISEIRRTRLRATRVAESGSCAASAPAWPPARRRRRARSAQ
jgi:hypothetical protein